MKVKFKKLSSCAVTPAKAHATDAGYDLVATSMNIDDNHNIVYGTGIAVEIPNGYVGYLFPRSSVSKTDLSLRNCVGVIDAGYRGEIMLKFVPYLQLGHIFCIEPFFIKSFKNFFRRKINIDMNFSLSSHFYNVGDKIGQLIIMPRPNVEFVEVDNLSDSERGEGGFGSTDIVEKDIDKNSLPESLNGVEVKEEMLEDGQMSVSVRIPRKK